MKNARYLLVDFLNFGIGIGLIIFVILYIVLGDRVGFVAEIMRSLVPIAFMVLFIQIRIVTSRGKVEKVRKERDFDEILVYLTKVERVMDWAVLILVPTLVLLVSWFTRSYTGLDLFQAIFVFVVFALFHKIVFRKEQDDDYLNLKDKFMDIVLYHAVPLVVALSALKIGPIEFFDYLQAGIVYGGFLLWHKLLYKIEE